ncbi:hypothetical protein QU668_10570 [Schaalia sp. HMT-877]|nr:hypothetical protein HMPREF1550_01261 [Actinomyces sp. oral taxon 877 str. F0543]WLD79959.1 hypothetical protein QU668_10570 [Schaalia sp. HMT-877]
MSTEKMPAVGGDAAPYIVDAAGDILLICDRILEMTNAKSPYSMSCDQMTIATDANNIGLIAKKIMAEANGLRAMQRRLEEGDGGTRG